MSEVLITSLIFLGGIVLVFLVFALDEIVAMLGFQPKSAMWEVAPLSGTESVDDNKDLNDGTGRKDPEAVRSITPRKAGSRQTGFRKTGLGKTGLAYPSTMSGLPAASR